MLAEMVSSIGFGNLTQTGPLVGTMEATIQTIQPNHNGVPLGQCLTKEWPSTPTMTSRGRGQMVFKIRWKPENYGYWNILGPTFRINLNPLISLSAVLPFHGNPPYQLQDWVLHFAPSNRMLSMEQVPRRLYQATCTFRLSLKPIKVAWLSRVPSHMHNALSTR